MAQANIRSHRTGINTADTAAPASGFFPVQVGAGRVFGRFKFSAASQSATFDVWDIDGAGTVFRARTGLVVAGPAAKLTGEATYNVASVLLPSEGAVGVYLTCSAAPASGTVAIDLWQGTAEGDEAEAVANLATSAGQASLLAAAKPVALATAVHVTNATSAAAVNVTCAAGTFAIEGYCESSFYYRRAATAVATDTLHPAGRFNIPAVAGTFSILVSSASATRIDAVPMGVA